MPTVREERRKSPRSSSAKKASASTATAASAALSLLGPEAILDLVQRLGLVDVVAGKIRSRLEEADLDDVFDDVIAYCRRNPEVVVVGLAAITVAAAVVVYLERLREWDGDDRRAARKRN